MRILNYFIILFIKDNSLQNKKLINVILFVKAKSGVLYSVRASKQRSASIIK